MPRLPTYRDVDQTGLQNTQRVLQGPRPVGNVPAVQDRRGESIANFGSAIVEITDRIRNAQIEAEVRSTDIKTRVALDKFKNNLSGIDDEQTYEKSWNEGAAKIIADAGNGLSSPMARQMWKSRGEEYFGQGLVDVRDMARKRGVDKLRASLVEKSALAVNLQDDVTVSESTRKAAVTDVTGYADSMAAQGFISNEDAARIKTGLETTIAKKEKERSQLAMAQDYEDRFWKESGGDYGKASEMARAIEDPELRDIVQNRIDDRFRQQKVIEDQHEQEASEQVAAIYARGGSLSSVPAETLKKLKPSTLLSLKSAERAELRAIKADQREALRDASAINTGSLTAASNERRDEFIKEGWLEGEFEKRAITPEDQSKLLILRSEIRTGKGGENLDMQIFKDVKSIAGPMLDKYTGDRKGKRQPLVEDALNASILTESRAFAEKNKRKPDAKETNEIIARAVIALDENTLKLTRIGRSADGNVVKAQGAGPVPFVISYQDQNRIRKVLETENPGKVITPQDIRNEYARYLKEKGALGGGAIKLSPSP